MIEGNPFAVTSRPLDHSGWLVTARGDLDLFTVPRLKTALAEALEAGAERLVVDLCEITALDSSGLAALVNAHRRLAPLGGAIVVVVGDADTEQKFRLTGLDQVFAVERRVRRQ